MALIWIIGSGGLLGNSLKGLISQTADTLFDPEVKFSWEDKLKASAELKIALDNFVLRVNQGLWKIYWAAGKGNMHSTVDDLQNETFILKNFITELTSHKKFNFKSGSFIFSSSAGAVYAGKYDSFITESSLPSPINAYGEIKLEQESIVSMLNKNNKYCNVIIYRISNLYGFKKNSSSHLGLITEIVKKILLNEVIHIYVPLETMRDYISAKAAAELMINSTFILEENPGIHIKIIASGSSTSIAQIMNIIKKISKRNLRVITLADIKSNQYQPVIYFKSQIAQSNNLINSENLIIGISELFTVMRSNFAQRN